MYFLLFYVLYRIDHVTQHRKLAWISRDRIDYGNLLMLVLSISSIGQHRPLYLQRSITSLQA